MKQTTKKIARQIALFGLLLAGANILTSQVWFQFFPKGINWMQTRADVFLVMFVNSAIQIGILFWGLVHIGKHLPKMSYWRLVLIAMAILLLNYHIHYLCELVNYYFIHPQPKQPSGDDMEKVMEWIYAVNEHPAPAYNPVFYILGSLLIDLLYSLSSFQFGWALFFLITGIPTMPLWVSGIALPYIRRKRKQVK